MTLALVHKTDPILRRGMARLETFGDLTAPIAELFQALDAHPGAIALAAPQVGLPLRALVWRLPSDDGHAINPVIVSRSAKKRRVTEGCLTYPGQFWTTPRHTWVDVTWDDRFGRGHSERAHGLKAQMWQHEIDHLDGVLLPERLGSRKVR